jgi:hypothetical protein
MPPQHSTAQHSTAQHSTAQHSTAQHSTAQHSTAYTHKARTCTHTRRHTAPTLTALAPGCWKLEGAAVPSIVNGLDSAPPAAAVNGFDGAMPPGGANGFTGVKGFTAPPVPDSGAAPPNTEVDADAAAVPKTDDRPPPNAVIGADTCGGDGKDRATVRTLAGNTSPCAATHSTTSTARGVQCIASAAASTTCARSWKRLPYRRVLGGPAWVLLLQRLPQPMAVLGE